MPITKIWTRIRHSTLASLVLIISVLGAVAAVTFFTVTVNQTVNVVNPFNISVTSSIPNIVCTGSTTITCSTVSLGVNATETLTATVTFNTVNSVSYTASSSNITVATITPPSGTITSPTITQSFTITGIATGSTTIILKFT